MLVRISSESTMLIINISTYNIILYSYEYLLLYFVLNLGTVNLCSFLPTYKQNDVLVFQEHRINNKTGVDKIGYFVDGSVMLFFFTFKRNYVFINIMNLWLSSRKSTKFIIPSEWLTGSDKTRYNFYFTSSRLKLISQINRFVSRRVIDAEARAQQSISINL